MENQDNSENENSLNNWALKPVKASDDKKKRREKKNNQGGTSRLSEIGVAEASSSGYDQHLDCAEFIIMWVGF